MHEGEARVNNNKLQPRPKVEVVMEGLHFFRVTKPNYPQTKYLISFKALNAEVFLENGQQNLLYRKCNKVIHHKVFGTQAQERVT